MILKKFAESYGVKHCISCANGTDSLYIIMKMLGITAGNEVITAANSWISSSETISQTGATPVFADIDPLYYTIDEKQLKQKITSRTKAIIPVHLQGQMCEMDTILALAAKYNIAVIEDCAQSHFLLIKVSGQALWEQQVPLVFIPVKTLVLMVMPVVS